MLGGKSCITDEMMRNAFAGNEAVWVTKYGGTEKWLVDSLETVLAEVEDEQENKQSDWR